LETKDRILKKADEICRRVGLRAMTLDEIASQLSISKKTIYQFFEDKDNLVDAIMALEIANTTNDCMICCETAENAVDEFFLSLEAMKQDMKDLNPIVLHDLEKFHFKTFTKFMNFKNEFFYNIVSNNLQKGIQEGLYLPDIEIEILTKLRLETMMLPFQQESFPANKYDFIKVNNTICKHFLYGILTEKGRKLLSNYKI
jgi:TetR/AcrR family transcriptional regulator, cholesterol catabolism regulator